MSTTAVRDAARSPRRHLSSRENPKVLCIEDDPDFMSVLQLRLGQYDVDVIQAFFGTQGVWLAQRENPDVIITDVRMPQGNGPYVIECLRDNDKTGHIPIVVVTAERSWQALRHLRDLGAASCLTKPLRFKDLVCQLSRYIDFNERDYN